MTSGIEHDEIEVGSQGSGDAAPAQPIIRQAMGEHDGLSRTSGPVIGKMPTRNFHEIGRPWVHVCILYVTESGCEFFGLLGRAANLARGLTRQG